MFWVPAQALLQLLPCVDLHPANDYDRRCLLARRLAEDGVRSVCVVSGGGSGHRQWDVHKDIAIAARCCDIHTTILHQFGLKPDALSYMHQGRREWLTEVHGRVIGAVV